jgi:hypothetical protein
MVSRQDVICIEPSLKKEIQIGQVMQTHTGSKEISTRNFHVRALLFGHILNALQESGCTLTNWSDEWEQVDDVYKLVIRYVVSGTGDKIRAFQGYIESTPIKREPPQKRKTSKR